MSYGKCSKCGADNKLSKAGKVYCGNKCWLNGQQSQPKPFYDKRIAEKERADGQSWGNAKTNAVNWALALYNKGEIESKSIKNTVEKIANWIHNLEPSVHEKSHIPAPPQSDLPVIETDNDDIDISQIPF